MSIDPHQMCFGLHLDLDQRSLSCFLRLMGRKEFAETLSSRMSAEEIDGCVQFLTDLMKKKLSEDEYHTLFLGEDSPHTPSR